MALVQFETAVCVWCLRWSARGHGHGDEHACDTHRTLFQLKVEDDAVCNEMGHHTNNSGVCSSQFATVVSVWRLRGCDLPRTHTTSPTTAAEVPRTRLSYLKRQAFLLTGATSDVPGPLQPREYE